ncbi:metallophosphoesterase [Alicyclobacillus acidoterrestris]|uniref:TIGR00282 family metallophosphoesterase n=1 Tax=Alicyclobacillus suci TaxID=2816080 RepID=UPI0011958D4B|nr:TIGR00282 family metallophosphoesterase [Alicyclobacillus suci]GEO24885.1 metallophosphoesterase [Alicyclobacillus acidoterrestris]
MKILFIGDIVGEPGRRYVGEILDQMLPEMQPDLVVANAENATRGRGLSRQSAEELYDAGVEILTMGNHTWDQRQIFEFIDDDMRIVRPANYPQGTPGRGFTVVRVGKHEVLIINVMGRTFLSTLDCPFEAVDKILADHPQIRHVLVDMHAEVTSEKLGMGWAFAGKVSAVLGTHTHVPTADARILPGGTAYISDVGMVGPHDGILGMKREQVIRRMRTQLPTKFEVADGPRQFCAVLLELDDESGKALRIEQVHCEEPSA